jgi:hypothetical protein
VPDYLWWGLTLSRDFEIPNIGIITVSGGYFQTSVSRSDCVPINGRGQDICGARAFGMVSAKF